jgi:hypothetical protein
MAVAAPVIAQRFEVQEMAQDYRTSAARLAGQLATPELEWRHGGWKEDRRLSYLETVSFTLEQANGRLTSIAPHERDQRSLSNFLTFDLSQFGAADRRSSELGCLAEAVYYEARSEGLEGQIAVAEVVMNRLGDPNFPKTICEVVYEGAGRRTGCQFTFTCDGSLRKRPRGAAWERARAVALHVQLGLNKPVTNEATHYHTDYVNPYWSAGMVETVSIGSHIFYRFPRGAIEWSQAQRALAAADEHDEALMRVEAEAEVDSAGARPPEQLALDDGMEQDPGSPAQRDGTDEAQAL